MSSKYCPSFLVILVCLCAPAAAGTFTTLYNFGASGDGSTPIGPLAINHKGQLFGATYGGGANGQGTIFSLTPPAVAGGAWTETILWSFGGSGDGMHPNAAVATGANGVLYGTTTYGGANGDGTVYSLTPPAVAGGAWTEAVLYSFADANDGAFPARPVTPDTSGVIYGVTPEGGANGQGTVFSLTPPTVAGGAWTQATLYAFKGGNDGGVPEGLIIGANGVLYGATFGYGKHGFGTVFSLIPPGAPGGAWTEKVLYSFRGGNDGANPEAGVTLGTGGVLYGTTVSGGGLQYAGIAFSLTPPGTPGGAWTEAVLYRFSDLAPSGYEPAAGLLRYAKTGALDGVTEYGGSSTNPGYGTVFQLSKPASGNHWRQTVLHAFSGTDGSAPEQGLLRDTSGVLYGTTSSGGSSSGGTVYSITP